MTITISECIKAGLLRTAFQPIRELDLGKVLAFEALIRGPAQSPLETPAALFSLAMAEGCSVYLELEAARAALTAFCGNALAGRVFVNFSADAIIRLAGNSSAFLDCLSAIRLDPARVVVELTEKVGSSDIGALIKAIGNLRERGVGLALDDYGSGNANLSLWIGLNPDFIKIDRSIIDGATCSRFRTQVLRSLVAIADAGHVRLIAEGLENTEDLMICRDLGIPFGQGYLLGKPTFDPREFESTFADDAIHGGVIVRGA